VEFYQKWAGAPDGDRSQWKGPLLDPWSEQTQYSPVLLDLFKFLLESPEYVQRLKNHYQLFRAAVDNEFAKQKGKERSTVVSKTIVGLKAVGRFSGVLLRFKRVLVFLMLRCRRG
jgi:hypothetical protein